MKEFSPTTSHPTTEESTTPEVTRDDEITMQSTTFDYTTTMLMTTTPTPGYQPESKAPTTTKPPVCDTDADCEIKTQICNNDECICRQGYQENEQQECKEVRAFKVQWSVNDDYDDDLADPESDAYKAEATKQCSALDTACDSADDNESYKGCDVIRFSSGSIVTEFQIFYDVNTLLTPQVIQTNYIQAAINSGELSSVAVINGTLSVTDLDECEEGLHECSEHAECRNTETGFECQCRSGYKDSYDAKPGFYCEKVMNKGGVSVGLVIGAVVGGLVVVVLVVVIAAVVARKYYGNKNKVNTDNPDSPKSKAESKD